MIVVVFRRLVQTAFVLLILMTLTFWLLHILPGGPFETEESLPPEVKASLEARFHLNKPILEQYFVYLKSLGMGDLGPSYANADQTTLEIMTSNLPVTLKLGLASLILSFCLGLPLGIFAARHYNGWGDRLAMAVAATGVSFPIFLVGPLLVLFFSFYLDWLPPGLLQNPFSYVLPVLTLAFKPAALIGRLVRATALDTIHSDFIRTARASGLNETKIFYKYILKNSLIPVLGITGPLTASILSGSFVVELIFALPGLGHHYIESVTNRDYPLILALTLFFAVMLCMANLLADLISMAVDPRVRAT